jgi:hypothetical protein
VLLISPVCVQTGECPLGWYQLATTQGRLILSTNDPSMTGVTVNAALRDREDRKHSHKYNSSVSLPAKGLDAAWGLDFQGACSGTYDTHGPLNEGASGLPFSQLALCTIKQASSDPTPFGTLAFFTEDVSQCPPQWAPAQAINGRFLVPSWDGDVTPSTSQPLQPREDRQHAHTFSVEVRSACLSARLFAASRCCCAG